MSHYFWIFAFEKSRYAAASKLPPLHDVPPDPTDTPGENKVELEPGKLLYEFGAEAPLRLRGAAAKDENWQNVAFASSPLYLTKEQALAAITGGSYTAHFEVCSNAVLYQLPQGLAERADP